MNGAPAEQIDHDRFFKELLREFFLEFLELFFPKLAASLDPGSLEFLSEELYVNLFDGEKYRADIVVKARSLKAKGAYFLVHVEHQSKAPSDFPRRFFRYFSAIYEKHGIPLYPIVIYSHDTPPRKQPDFFQMDFPDGRVLRFEYRVVQLNRLSWRRFLKAHNPVASALMSKMKIAPRDRPRVKAECLRLLVTLKLNPAKMTLIASFVDAYLNLNQEEERRFEQSLTRLGMRPKQQETIVEYVTSWERRGIEKGLQQGLQQGREEGREEGLREAVLDTLTLRFGPPDASVTAAIRGIHSLEHLRMVMRQALRASSLEEVDLSAKP